MKPIKQYRLLIERMSHTTDFDTLVMIDALTDALDEVEKRGEMHDTLLIKSDAEIEGLSGDNERLKETIHGFSESATVLAVPLVETPWGRGDEAVSKTKLKPCPCGKTPAELCISESNTCKRAFASGDCCGEWIVEFRTDYYELDTTDCMKLAIAAWNKSPRG